MCPANDAGFVPTAPSRTFSSSSTLTVSSGETPHRAPSSPTEQSFFGAISSRVRGRSRSRSRNRAAATRPSRSPLPAPPTAAVVDSTTTLTNNAFAMAGAGAGTGVGAGPGPGSPTSPTSPTMAPTTRAPTQGSARSQESTNMWYGRHSNSWLFNDFSVTESFKGVLRRH